MSYQVNQADVVDWAKGYKDEPFHALLCDPPYELGFMGKTWDGTGISYQVETWKAYYDILYPGAFGMAFGGTRTVHRVTVAIEDAGFIIHPIIVWAFGQGFPKASRIDTRIDKEAGVEREVVGQDSDGRGRSNIKNMEAGYRPNPYSEGTTFDVTTASTPLAKAWEGHRYGLQALKPALEPIIVFQKPYEGNAMDSMIKYGSGGLWIEGGRIGTEQVISNRWKDDAHPFGGGAGNEYETVTNHGRWPSNFVLSHSPDCTDSECVPGCPILELGEQAGILTSGKPAGLQKADHNVYGNYGKGLITGFGDSGTAARFFHNSHWMLERLESATGFKYVPKANRTERNAGLDGFEEKTRSSMPGRRTND